MVPWLNGLMCWVRCLSTLKFWCSNHLHPCFQRQSANATYAVFWEDQYDGFLISPIMIQDCAWSVDCLKEEFRNWNSRHL